MPPLYDTTMDTAFLFGACRSYGQGGMRLQQLTGVSLSTTPCSKTSASKFTPCSCKKRHRDRLRSKGEVRKCLTKFEYQNLQVDKSRFIVANFAQEAVDGAHALVVFTSWDKFKTYPYHVLYDTLMHPAFLLDGRIVLNHTVLEDIGFKVHAIGKEAKDQKGSRPGLGWIRLTTYPNVSITAVWLRTIRPSRRKAGCINVA